MSALSPIDLLTMSSDEQTILRCLTRHPKLTVFDLAAQLNLEVPAVEKTVNSLLGQGRIVEQLLNGQRVFSTRFQFKQRAVRNMPAEIVNLLEQTPNAFLAEIPITSVLPLAAREKLLELGQKRTLLPDEVMVWQGQKTERIWLVKQGLLAQARLKSRHAKQRGGYLHRGSWVGLAESLSQTPIMTTYTAVTPTTLLTWPASDFFEFAQEHSQLGHALSHYLSQQLTICQQAHLQQQSKLWVVEGVYPQAGVTTFALNLAWLAQQQSASEQSGKTLFWATEQASALREKELGDASIISQKKVGLATITVYSDGPDRLTKIDPSSYAPQVQLDMLLSDLQAQYEYIICDTGSETQSELTLRLRGQAQTLITLTKDENGADEGLQKWSKLQPYSFPGQKRVLTLNATSKQAANIDPRFHLALPDDKEALTTSATQNKPLIKAAVDNPLSEALHEVYRRLSLNHAVALFVPSTVDVDQEVDNSQQVKATLSFLGNLFGGATSSDAEGAWRSEDSGLVTEQVTIVRTFVSKKALDTHLDDVIHFATDLKRDMKQEAVAVSVDNQLILV
jgi:CRP-like cAMP-binding protein